MIAKTHCFGEPNTRVKISVGGTLFETRLSVLVSAVAKDTMLGAMFSGRHRVDADEKTGTVLIDSGDSEVFGIVLNYLREPATFALEWSKFDDDSRASISRRAQFYNMPKDFHDRVAEVLSAGTIPFNGSIVASSNIYSHSFSERTRGWLDVDELQLAVDETAFAVDCRASEARFRITTLTMAGSYLQCRNCSRQDVTIVATDSSSTSVTLIRSHKDKSLHTADGSNLLVFESKKGTAVLPWFSGYVQLVLECESCKLNAAYNQRSLPAFNRQATICGLFGEAAVHYSTCSAVTRKAKSVQQREQAK